jgi:hypothetical protein
VDRNVQRILSDLLLQSHILAVEESKKQVTCLRIPIMRSDEISHSSGLDYYLFLHLLSIG